MSAPLSPMRLALKDLSHDRAPLFCLAMAMAAVLAPLLILLGLKNGVIDSALERLKTDPAVLRVSLRGNYAIDAERLEQIAALPGIGFLAPAPRTIAARLELEASDGSGVVRVGLLASAPGDPFLSGHRAEGLPRDTIALSPEAAAALGIAPGVSVTALAERGDGGFLEYPLTVAEIAERLPGRQALVPVALADAVEAFRDGYALPTYGVEAGRALAGRAVSYESLRLYAADIGAVASLVGALERDGFRTVSRVEEIRWIERLDRGLGTVLGLIAAVGGAGFVVFLSMTLIAEVERKRRSLATMRLMGMGRGAVSGFLAVQGLGVALLGVSLAFLAYGLFVLIAAPPLAAVLAEGPAGQNPIAAGAVTRLTTENIALCVGVTLVVTGIGTTLGSVRAYRIQPMEALRDPGG